ncbi:hypothetical protein [Bacillus smithii]|uniref:hypothetical protein n=1 Tax=Bacillus smithii TaxID=1479 RepID=UPI002E1F54BB|nr:hypothetical protein [Bacillus smithii]MED4929027.1 hypothetical protein [Bacillus smithii]
MKQWFVCPNCKTTVNFFEQMDYLFEDDGESIFDPEDGVWFHTVYCECGAYWVMSLSKMNLP